MFWNYCGYNATLHDMDNENKESNTEVPLLGFSSFGQN